MTHILDLVLGTDLGTILGWMFGCAIIIGGVLDNGWRDLRNWLVAVALFCLFNTIAAVAFMNDVGAVFTIPTVIEISVLVAATYCVGLVIGWATVYLTKRSSRRGHAKIDSSDPLKK